MHIATNLLCLQKSHELGARDDLGIAGIRGKVGAEELPLVVKEVLATVNDGFASKFGQGI